MKDLYEKIERENKHEFFGILQSLAVDHETVGAESINNSER